MSDTAFTACMNKAVLILYARCIQYVLLRSLDCSICSATKGPPCRAALDDGLSAVSSNALFLAMQLRSHLAGLLQMMGPVPKPAGVPALSLGMREDCLVVAGCLAQQTPASHLRHEIEQV